MPEIEIRIKKKIGSTEYEAVINDDGGIDLTIWQDGRLQAALDLNSFDVERIEGFFREARKVSKIIEDSPRVVA